MSSRSVATLYWGGRIVRNQNGRHYKGGRSTMFEFGEISTFAELHSTIKGILNLPENQYIRSLMWRQPILIPGNIRYDTVEVDNDAAVKLIMDFVLQCGGSMGFLQFYAIVDEQQVINVSLGGGSNVHEDDTNLDDNDNEDDDSDEEDDLWLDTDDENDGGDEGHGDINMEAYYNTNCSNPILPLVHPQPYSEINFDMMQVDTRAKPGRKLLFDASKEFEVGMLFPSRDAVQLAAKEYSLSRNHQFRSDETRKETYVIKCGNPNERCGWRLRATNKADSMFWKITRYNGPHTCTNPQMSRDHRQLDQKYICGRIDAMVAAQPDIKIKPLMAEIKDKLGFEPTYYRVWAAKQRAIENNFGGWDESYGRLKQFMYVMQLMNPGSIFVIDDDLNWVRGQLDQSTRVFKRMFWTFKQTIEGFKSCRPVIFIDGTFLYGKYRGTLLCAAAFDGNNHIFPLAFAIVEKENIDNWTWFMDMLRMYVTSSDNICVISDRHVGIERAMETEGWRPPHAHHRYCIRHILSNYNTKFKNAEGKKLVQMAGKFLNK